jgi:hypothetical protein
MASLEAEIKQLETDLERASNDGRVDDVFRMGRQYEETRKQLDHLMEEWTELA